MIVVVGSRHDSVATDLVAFWPGAALCSAEDLVQRGWVWHHAQPLSRTWIVGSKPVRDSEVTGVYIRRASVYAEELVTTHPADRTYLAAEANAFLTFVLATTSARVINPVFDGAFGEEALRPERWTPFTSQLGISLRPFRIANPPRRQRRYRANAVEVVEGQAFGDGSPQNSENALRLANAMGLAWLVVIFDGRRHLTGLTSATRPSDKAAQALGRILEAGRT